MKTENETKAKEIAGLKEINDEERYYQSEKCKIYDAVLQAMEWKQNQLIDKACEWLKFNLQFYDENYEERDSGSILIDDFKKAMKGE